MAKYDPKRPVLLADDEDVAQVDALLGSAEKTVTDGPMMEPEAPASGSGVPVVTPPDGGTLNRAVLGAVVLAIVSAVVAVVIVRRRRRD